jgi:PAS domain S-box-containing protein
MKFIRRLLDISTTDPDDARRRKLLNILLLALIVLMLVGFVAIPLATLVGLAPPVPTLFYFALPVMLVAASLIYAINRYWSGKVAAWVFLVILAASMFTAPPQQALSGHNMLAFSIPIVIASFLLYPAASYLMATLVSLATAVVGSREPSIGVQVSPMLTLFLIALISWIAAHGLENALKDLRILNRELDQRVIERTRDLAQRSQELAEALAKNQAILDSTADGVIVFDTGNKAIVANPAIAGLLGRPVHRITDRTIEALMGEDVDSADRENVVQLLTDRENAHSGIKFRWGKKTFAASLAPVRDNSGQVIGTVAVFRDFTREAEIDRMKSTFVSIASHELRTPLSGIIGYTDMLQAGVYGELSEQQRDVIGRIVANSGQLLSLANNLLDRAQIETGRLNLRISTFSPTELVNSVQGVMDVMTRAKGLQLTSHIADDVPATLAGDRQRLHQILINLTGNAIKFTNVGKVEIRVTMHDADHWALAVTDTGAGIPPEAREYIFEAFRQVDDPATRQYGGAGLGLSIVKQLVTLMGGDITLESEIGKGSTFTITLPLTPPAQDEAESAA